MTWTKLSDDFGDDCWELSDAAYRLHVEGLLWSNRNSSICGSLNPTCAEDGRSIQKR